MDIIHGPGKLPHISRTWSEFTHVDVYFSHLDELMYAVPVGEVDFGSRLGAIDRTNDPSIT